ncbi:hypothetical protein EYF80_002566 [Liparis tanakae]|uniref:Uncharacterized protein n=1 Tax=Liparis tanakae TaxID=230148 RepID=A0A4Z2JAI8_9TELE|nr:hypothetical protein EYF80_002566 [Liparis tanakae]
MELRVGKERGMDLDLKGVGRTSPPSSGRPHAPTQTHLQGADHLLVIQERVVVESCSSAQFLLKERAAVKETELSAPGGLKANLQTATDPAAGQPTCGSAGPGPGLQEDIASQSQRSHKPHETTSEGRRAPEAGSTSTGGLQGPQPTEVQADTWKEVLKNRPPPDS